MMKGQKGITLVALIITIIVMLILVGVSISVALNGGLFTKARTASRETRIAQINEAIALAATEVYADYYESNETLTANDRDASKVADLINSYLENMTVTLNDFDATTGKYTVKAVTGIDLTTEELGNLKSIECAFWKTTTP